MKSARVSLGVLLASGTVWAQQYVISTVAGGAPPPSPITAVNASAGRPTGVATDSAGNVYFGSLSLNTVFKLSQNGIMTRVAGNGRAGYSGDGGAATNAQLFQPAGLSVDGAGNLYIADAQNSCIRMVSSGGVINTVAGVAGEFGFSGDGSPATNAELYAPNAVAVDGAGNIYIADNSSRIREVSSNGIISTVAGNGGGGYSGDGGPATNAQLKNPDALAIDSSGNLYIADGNNNRVRKVSPNGIISTVAGNGGGGYSGDGGPATNAQLGYPSSVAIDSAGNLYIGDGTHHVVRKVSVAGIISTVAGSGPQSYSGDGGPATSATLDIPAGLAVDGQGNLFIADLQNDRIRRVSPSGIISTVAGNGTQSYSGDGGPATSAQLGGPGSAVADGQGNLYIADTLNQRIRKVSSNGIISTVAGNGVGGYSGNGGPATNAQLLFPAGVALDGAGNMYIADTTNGRVRKVSANGVISTVAGTGSGVSGGDGGPAMNAQLSSPLSLAIDAAGNLYIADNGSRIRKVSPSGIISTVAGNGTYGFSGDGGAATSAQLMATGGYGDNVFLPVAVGSVIAVDRAGNLYIADTGNNRIRMVSPNGTISTVAGSGGSAPPGDGGPATSAALQSPDSVAVDSAGSLYIGESGRIRKISPAGIISTIAGGNPQGYSGDGGPALSAQLFESGGVSVDGAGNVYIADSANYAIRRLQPTSQPGLSITAVSSLPSGTAGAAYSQVLTASGGSPPYTWSLTTGNLPVGLTLSPSGAISGTPAVAGVSTFTVRVTDGASSVATKTFSITISQGSLMISAVANAASNLPGPITSGEIVVISGSGLGPTNLLAGFVADPSVTFDGIPAIVIYAESVQVQAVIPDAVAGESSTQVQVQYQGQTSHPMTLQVASAAPGLFTLDGSGKGQGVIFNQDGTTNRATNPATKGSVVSLFATGTGQVDPNSIVVGINNAGAQVISIATVPSLVGVVEINVTVPDDAPSGNSIPVAIEAGGAFSQGGVTIAIQ